MFKYWLRFRGREVLLAQFDWINRLNYGWVNHIASNRNSLELYKKIIERLGLSGLDQVFGLKHISIKIGL